MILNKTKKLENRELFIKKYRAALSADLSKEQFANYVGIKSDSIVRRRLVIRETTGLDLPYLRSDGISTLTEEDLKRYRSELGKLTKDENKLKIDIVENSDPYKRCDRFVVTSAQNCTPIHEGFLASILNYCDENNAQLLVIPYRYKNPTSIFQDSEKDYWDEKIKPFIMDNQIKLCKNLQVVGQIKIQPTAIQPLYGFESYTGSDSAIVGHPKVQLKTVPTPSNTIPKVILSTGAITLPNYTDSKAGWRGLSHHSFAAVVVEIDRANDIFHLRHIHGDKGNGAFYDIAGGELKYYTSNGSTSGHRASVLVTGDSHALLIDPVVEAVTYTNTNSIINLFKPQKLMLHDVLDGYSVSHHHKGNDIISIGKHRYKKGNIEDELQITADFIDRVVREDMETYIIKSNHDEHFDRWLKESNPKLDPENAQFYHWMKYHEAKSIRPTNTGFSSIDPFEFWCNNPDKQRGLINKHLVKILKRDESLMIGNIEYTFHGDKGANGAKGSDIAFAKAGPKFIKGHTHSASIYEGVTTVGTSSYIDLEYKSGLDSWIQSHAIVYPDNHSTLINIIKGHAFL